MRTWLAIAGFVAAAMAAFAELPLASKLAMWLAAWFFLWLAWSLGGSLLVLLDSYLFSISDLASPLPAFSHTIPAIAVFLLLLIVGQILRQAGAKLPGSRESRGGVGLFGGDGDSGGCDGGGGE